MSATSTDAPSLEAAMPVHVQRQSARGSLVEALVNVGLGFIVAVATQRAVFPMLGIHISFSADLAVACVFTTVSLLRTFAVRRLFEAIGRHRARCGPAHRKVVSGGQSRRGKS